MIRHCMNPHCRREITKCDGLALCRDVVAMLQGRLTTFPRELCGRCGFVQGYAEWAAETGVSLTPRATEMLEQIRQCLRATIHDSPRSPAP